MAEVELNFENEPYEKPDFIGKEVTGNRLYYNFSLRAYLFSQWTEEERNTYASNITCIKLIFSLVGILFLTNENFSLTKFKMSLCDSSLEFGRRYTTNSVHFWEYHNLLSEILHNYFCYHHDKDLTCFH